MMSSKNSQLSALIETALVAALAMALSYIPDFCKLVHTVVWAIPWFSLLRQAQNIWHIKLD